MYDKPDPPVVYILRESFIRYGAEAQRPLDYTPALDFGQIEFVTNSEPSVSPGSRFNEDLVSDLRTFAAKYRPEIDYIVPSGATTMVLLAGMLLGQRHRRVQVLHWHNARRAYLPIIWDLNGD